MPKKSKNTHEDIVKRLGNIKILDEYKGTVRQKHKFLCPLCNKEFTARLDSVLSGHTKSCRCKVKGNRTGTENVSGRYFNQILTGAKRRNIVFELTVFDLEELLIKQNFKCALSGLTIEVGYYQNEDRINVTASLDRIDSNKGYVKGNVQWVHKKVNLMKNHLSESEFINICKMITKNSLGKLD